jgi:hypothetical protein
MLKNRTQVINEEIADVLEETAYLLGFQEANPHRVRAFRNGARAIRDLPRPVDKMVAEEGLDSLEKVPGIGEGLKSIIGEYLQTGRSSLLDRLQGEVSTAEIISQIGGIGPELAARVVQELDIHSLEELEEAAYDGRLEKVKGFGPQRLKTVRDSLAGILSRSARRRVVDRVSGRPNESQEEPSAGLLLEIDAEYKRKAQAGRLRKVAPKRFNPQGEAWLPVMRVERDGWSFMVLYSNTALAHKLNMTRDWVVIYYERGGIEKQVTVVTAKSGSLKGKRMVRGREAETRKYYETQNAEARNLSPVS